MSAQESSSCASCVSLRQQLARQALTIHERQESWHEMRQQLSAAQADWHNTEDALMEAKEEITDLKTAHAALRSALEKLVAKLLEMQPYVEAHTSAAYAHGVTYDGPSWSSALIEARNTLAALRIAQEPKA